MTQLKLRPSRAPRWVPCPGSARMEAAFPETEPGQAAEEGTAAHWAASESLLTWVQGAGKLPAQWVGKTAPNGVIVTEEMAKAVTVYVNDLLTVCQRTGGLQALRVEKTIDIHSVHSCHSGTPDCALYSAHERTLYVWDFKYGWGVVSAFENWQLLDYAVGLAEQLPSSPENVELRIVQPRPYLPRGPVDSWRISGAVLESEYLPSLRDAASAATQPQVGCVPGGHCANCKASLACPALNAAVLRCMDICEMAAPEDITGASLGAQVGLLQLAETLVKERKSGVEAQALAMLARGQHVPGWTAEPGRGSRKWAADREDILALGEMAGADLDNPGVITPAQAEKAGVDKEMVKCYTATTPGALKLVKQDTSVFNRKPEVN